MAGSTEAVQRETGLVEEWLFPLQLLLLLFLTAAVLVILLPVDEHRAVGDGDTMMRDSTACSNWQSSPYRHPCGALKKNLHARLTRRAPNNFMRSRADLFTGWGWRW